MKVIVAGSRNFNDKELLFKTLNKLNSVFEITSIISGTARGADTLGEVWAFDNGIEVLRFKPDWSKGKSAGFKRNAEMAEVGDCLIAFWDGSSTGTKHMIDLAIKKGLKVKIVNF